MLQTLCCYGFSFAIFLTLWACIPTFVLKVIGTIFILGSTTYLCFLLAEILDRLLPRRRISSLNKAVFITGCDTGFGHLLAKRLDFKGYKVFAGCFLPTGPDAERLRKTTSSNLRVIEIDVTSDESVQNALKNIREGLANAELWAVVNNAGIMMRGESEWTPLELYKRQLEVNTFGVVRVTQAFLPLLRKYKGRVVTTTSFAGRHTFSNQVPYSMSKHAANSFCDGLRLEMEKWDVKVVTVEPFAYRTSMTDLKHAVECFDDAWSKAPDDVKQSYGAQYAEECRKAIIKFNEFAPSYNTNQVIDCLEEAVTAYSPHYSYTPGDLKSVVSFWFLKRLPPTVANGIIRAFITFDTDINRCVRKRIQEKIDDR